LEEQLQAYYDLLRDLCQMPMMQKAIWPQRSLKRTHERSLKRTQHVRRHEYRGARVSC